LFGSNGAISAIRNRSDHSGSCRNPESDHSRFGILFMGSRPITEQKTEFLRADGNLILTLAITKKQGR
jgi:hypothetical protein